jgi:hypothetical protein
VTKEPTTFVPARAGPIVTAVTATVIPEPSIAATSKGGESLVTSADIFGSVRLGLFTFLANLLDIGEKLDELFRAIPYYKTDIYTGRRCFRVENAYR